MEKRQHSPADWSNYWEGRLASATGEVLAGPAIESDAELARFWSEALSGSADSCILDVGCGAGSALKHAPMTSGTTRIGVDVSPAALETAQVAIPGMIALLGSADQLPVETASVDHVISQFGFEYAGRLGPAAEIQRVLRSGGRFTAIAHIVGGAIAQECDAHLAQLNTIEDSDYISASKAFFEAVFSFEAAPSSAGRAEVQARARDLRRAQAAMAPTVSTSKLAAYLQSGARRLYERRKAYELEDIIGWLDSMQNEVSAYRGRMQSMISAALSEQEARAILNRINPNSTGTARPFDIGGKVAAWLLKVPRE